MTGESKTTSNQNEIRRWAEARGGKPVTINRETAMERNRGS